MTILINEEIGDRQRTLLQPLYAQLHTTLRFETTLRNPNNRIHTDVVEKWNVKTNFIAYKLTQGFSFDLFLLRVISPGDCSSFTDFGPLSFIEFYYSFLFFVDTIKFILLFD